MSPARTRLAAGLTLVAAGLVAGSVRAHPLAPSLLELHEHADGRVAVRWKTPLVQPRGAILEPVLPPGCARSGDATTRREGAAAVTRFELACGPGGLAGRRVGVRGLESSGTNALLRVVRPDGTVASALLDARDAQLAVAADPGALRRVARYARLGALHLAGGLDHVLFVLALLALVRGRRQLLVTVSAFTLGHSMTLSLATLGLVRFPSAATELAIAASLVWLAAELPDAGRARGGVFRRHPARAALGFGLLHGLGFAGALAELGLPAAEIPLALAAFNAGIELGQLGLVALALALHAVLRARAVPLAAGPLRLAAAYGLGALAGSWVVARSLEAVRDGLLAL